MFGDHPLLGVGISNYPPVRKAGYMDPADHNWHESVPHSTYIQAIAELGLAGVLPLIALILLLFRLNSKTRKRLLASDPGNRRSYEYCLAIGLDLGLVGYLSSGAFVAVLYYPHLWILLGISVGLHKAVYNRDESKSAELKPGRESGESELVAVWDER